MATGKFSIWTAKMKAATRPASGAVRSSSSRRAPRRLTATAVAATAPAATETGALMNPSGTCMERLRFLFLTKSLTVQE